MAASMSLSQRKEDFKDLFLTCSLCFELYDNDEHQAKCLPCLHSYCKSCLRQHAGKYPRLKCPNCRIVVKLVDGCIDNLPNNFIVQNLKDFQDIFNLAVICSNCDEGGQAVSFCHDCGCFVCERCVDNHQKMRSLRHHKLSTMQELKENKRNPLRQQLCKKHPTKPLDLYCKNPRCKVTACASCGLIDHRGHAIIDLTTALSEIVAVMRQSSTHVATRNQELTKKRTAVEMMQKTLTDNFNKSEKAMQESTQTLQSVIDSHYDKAHSHLKQMYQTEMNQLTEHNESVDLLATQMTSACEFANKACDTSQSVQLLTSQNQIMERLRELDNATVPATDSDKTDFGLTFKHYLAIEQIEGAMKNVCDVDWWTLPQLSNELEEKKNTMKNLGKKVLTLEQKLQDQSLSRNDVLTIITEEREAFGKKLEVARKEMYDLRCTTSGQIVALMLRIGHLNTKITEDGEELKNKERRITDLEKQHKEEIEDFNQRLLASEKQTSENARLLVEKETQLADQREAFDNELEVARKEMSELRYTSSEQIGDLEQQIVLRDTKITEDSEELQNKEGRITDLEKQHLEEIEDLNQRLLASEKQTSENAMLLVEKETQLADQREASDKKLEVSIKELLDLRSSNNKQIAALEQQIANLNTKITEDSEEIKIRDEMIANLEEQHWNEKEDLNQRLLASKRQASENARLFKENETQVARQIAHMKDKHRKEIEDLEQRLVASENQAYENARLLIEKKTQVAGQVDPSQCTIKLRQPSGLDYLRTATVQIVDYNEQLITTGGIKVEATQDWDARYARRNKDGTYTIQYGASWGLLYVNINGTPMEGSPFTP